jgi:phosphoethanolamine N-methyltransferase
MSNDENIVNTDEIYTDEEIAEFEAMFGEGFLSPGGQEEVAKIVENVSLAGKEVLDIGVGIGGPACLLIEKHGAARVTGIDVEDTVLETAAQTVLRRGLQDRVILKRVEPGPLPFDDESFDVVFSKDAIIHIPDKGALFREIYRILKSDGCIAMSDWYRGEETLTEEMTAWLEPHGSEFVMTPIQNDADLLGSAGFVDIAILVDIPHMNRQPDHRLRNFGVVGNALCPGSAQEPLTMSQGAPRQSRWIGLVAIKAHLSCDFPLQRMTNRRLTPTKDRAAAVTARSAAGSPRIASSAPQPRPFET